VTNLRNKSQLKNAAMVALTIAVIAQVVWCIAQVAAGTPVNQLTRPFLFTGAFLIFLVTRGQVRAINTLARIVVAGAFLSALWNRFDNFTGFISYTGLVNSFLPKAVIPTIAVVATIAEITCCSVMLLGIRVRFAAVGSGVLLFMFATAMTISGLSQFEWAVYVLAAGSLALATVDASLLSVDSILTKERKSDVWKSPVETH